MAAFIRKIFKSQQSTPIEKEPLIDTSEEIDWEEILKSGEIGNKNLTSEDFKQAKMILSNKDYKRLKYIAMMQNLQDYNLN